VRSLAGTHRLCKEWELVDPIFSERDGGDPQKVGLVHVSLSIPISHFCLVGSTPTAQFSLAKSGLYPEPDTHFSSLVMGGRRLPDRRKGCAAFVLKVKSMSFNAGWCGWVGEYGSVGRTGSDRCHGYDVKNVKCFRQSRATPTHVVTYVDSGS
jgi:hypothetical protein